jgi:hypothetical protein
MVYIKLVFGFLCQSVSSFGLRKSRRLGQMARQGLKSSFSLEWFEFQFCGVVFQLFGCVGEKGCLWVFWICPSRQIISVYNFLRNGCFGFISFFLS